MLNSYYRPASLEEALDLLSTHRGGAKVLAGATDLFLDLEKGRKTASCLVDVRAIPELGEIRADGDRLFLGAAVTHARVAVHPLVRAHLRALAEAAASVGSPQTRNIGTIGGNVVNAQPAADAAVALFALDAEAEVADAGGLRRLPIAQLYLGPGRSAVDSTRSILTGFYLPLGRFQATGFSRAARRAALSLPVLNLAAALRLEGGILREVRLAAGPVSDTPLRLTEAERLLEGQPPGPGLFRAAGNAAAGQAAPRNSLLRGSGSYRKELLGVMTARLLAECCATDERKGDLLE